MDDQGIIHNTKSIKINKSIGGPQKDIQLCSKHRIDLHSQASVFHRNWVVFIWFGVDPVVSFAKWHVLGFGIEESQQNRGDPLLVDLRRWLPWQLLCFGRKLYPLNAWPKGSSTKAAIPHSKGFTKIWTFVFIPVNYNIRSFANDLSLFLE